MESFSFTPTRNLASHSCRLHEKLRNGTQGNQSGFTPKTCFMTCRTFFKKLPLYSRNLQTPTVSRGPKCHQNVTNMSKETEVPGRGQKRVVNNRVNIFVRSKRILHLIRNIYFTLRNLSSTFIPLTNKFLSSGGKHTLSILFCHEWYELT